MGREIKELDLFRIYKLLDHPVRKEIIELLGDHERLGFKEFKERLQINVGSLYYHFDVLSGLIAQDENRKYILTDLGKMAYQFLTSKKGRLMELEVKEKARIISPRNRIFRYAKSIFLPYGLFVNLYQSPKRHLADVALILAFGSWLMIETKLEPILFFFNFGASPPEMIVARLLSGLLVIIAISEAISRIFFQRSGGNLSLLVGASFSLLPLFVFPALLLFENWDLIVFIDPFWTGILQFFLQAWSLCALTSAISLSKGLRIEKAAVVSLVLIYLNLGYVYFTSH
jgi:DNA-binding transcriptional ArsR family regulator